MKIDLGLGLGSRGGGKAWTPSKLPGINKWFDAHNVNTITKDGDNKVSQWDSVCSNLAATAYKQTNLSYAPTYDAVKKALIFDGAQAMFRDHALPTGNVNITWIYIYKRTGAFGESSRYLLAHNGTAIRLYSSAVSNILLRTTATLTLSVVDDVLKDQYRMLVANYVNTGNSSIDGFYHGGTVGSPTDVTVTGNAGTAQFNATQLILGALNTNGGNGFLGELKAVISVLGTISAADMVKLKQFAREYYGAVI